MVILCDITCVHYFYWYSRKFSCNYRWLPLSLLYFCNAIHKLVRAGDVNVKQRWIDCTMTRPAYMYVPRYIACVMDLCHAGTSSSDRISDYNQYIINLLLFAQKKLIIYIYIYRLTLSNIHSVINLIFDHLEINCDILLYFLCNLTTRL